MLGVNMYNKRAHLYMAGVGGPRADNCGWTSVAKTPDIVLPMVCKSQ